VFTVINGASTSILAKSLLSWMESAIASTQLLSMLFRLGNIEQPGVQKVCHSTQDVHDGVKEVPRQRHEQAAMEEN
jgi:hypothetical protein